MLCATGLQLLCTVGLYPVFIAMTPVDTWFFSVAPPVFDPVFLGLGYVQLG